MFRNPAFRRFCIRSGSRSIYGLAFSAGQYWAELRKPPCLATTMPAEREQAARHLVFLRLCLSEGAESPIRKGLRFWLWKSNPPPIEYGQVQKRLFPIAHQRHNVWDD